MNTTSRLFNRSINRKISKFLNAQRAYAESQLYQVLNSMHREQKKWLIDNLETQSKITKRRVIVVTHHPPSYLSIRDKFKQSSKNAFYANELDQEILHYKPDYWIHGHTHQFCDYQIGGTRVIGNPIGLQDE